MPKHASPSKSDGLHAGRVGSRQVPRWGQTPFLDASRIVLVATIWIAAWLIGGFYHLPRFLILSSLAAALLLAWLDLKHVAPMLRATRWLWFLSLGLIVIAVTQLVPLPSWLASAVSGTHSLREQYAGIDPSSWSIISLVPWESYNWIALALIGIVGLFLGAGLFQTPKARLFLLAAIAACGATQVFWGIVQIAVHPGEIIWGVPNEGGTTPFGTFLVRNHGADFVGMALFCAIGLMHYVMSSNRSSKSGVYEVPGGWTRLLSNPLVLSIALLVVWLLVGLVCSNSRGAWTSFVITAVAIALVWKHRKSPRRLGRFAGFLAVALLSMLVIQSIGFLDRFEARVDDLNVDRVMADGRWQIWRDSIPALLHFLPLGSGLGTYGYAILPFEPTTSRGWLPNAHNQYLEMLVEAGIPGILLVCGFLYVAGKAAISLCQSDRAVEKQALGIAGLGALLFQSLHAFTEFGLLMPANLLVACVLIGASVAASPSGRHRVSKSSKSASSKPGAVRLSVSSASRGPVLATSIVVLLMGAGVSWALWHQARCVRGERLLDSTTFAPSTPSPTVATADEWIEQLQQELECSPSNERLRRRLIQLHMHRAQRFTYDQIRAGQVAQARPTNPIDDWDRTSLGSIITKLYDESDRSPTELQKQRIKQQIASEPSLDAAWSQFALSLAANPVQPKTHMRMAQLAAASGRPWDEIFANSMRLSAVDPRQTLGNGLLAWAAGDIEAMTDQWRQTLSVDLTHLELIYRLSRLKLTDEAIAEHLMPNNWVAPYRLALKVKNDPLAEGLHDSLLHNAFGTANDQIVDRFEKHKTLAQIAVQVNDFPLALRHFEEAISLNPKGAAIRHRHALVLLHVGMNDQAEEQARVAVRLDPNQKRYKALLERIRRLKFQANVSVSK